MEIFKFKDGEEVEYVTKEGSMKVTIVLSDSISAFISGTDKNGYEIDGWITYTKMTKNNRLIPFSRKMKFNKRK